MTVRSKAVWIVRWLAPLGWLGAIILLGLWLLVPATRLSPRLTAWVVSLCVVVVALGHVARLRHGHPPGRFRPAARPELGQAASADSGSGRGPLPHPPRRYRGLSHSGERPRFD